MAQADPYKSQKLEELIYATSRTASPLEDRQTAAQQLYEYVSNMLDQINKNPSMAKSLSRGLSDVRKTVDMLSGLLPDPGPQIGKLVLQAADAAVTALTINQSLLELVRDSALALLLALKAKKAMVHRDDADLHRVIDEMHSAVEEVQGLAVKLQRAPKIQKLFAGKQDQEKIKKLGQDLKKCRRNLRDMEGAVVHTLVQGMAQRQQVPWWLYSDHLDHLPRLHKLLQPNHS